MKRKPRMKTAIQVAAIIMIVTIFGLWQNNSLTVTEFQYASIRVPMEFHGFKMVHISDLHNKPFGDEQNILLKQVKELSPDVILITGDLIDRRKYDLDTAMDFINGAVKIAPIYYVTGNHEAWSGKYPEIRNTLEAAGVTVMEDDAILLNRTGDGQEDQVIQPGITADTAREDGYIQLYGLSDPGFLTSDDIDVTNISNVKSKLTELSEGRAGRDPCGYTQGKENRGTDTRFGILLSHRPELFDLYREAGIDLVFAGHAHGGQFRIPFIGGLFAPNQGFFPDYTGGSYHEGSSTMYVSRGLGNSVIPIRIFNRPEIIFVVLKRTPQ